MIKSKIESEYDQQARAFLAKHDLVFFVSLVNDTCPQFCTDMRHGLYLEEVGKYPRKHHIHGRHYLCSIIETRVASGRGTALATVSFDFWNSYQDEVWNKTTRRSGEPRRVPGAYDLFTSITKSDPGSFADFCSEFGYDSDSRFAEEVYSSAVHEWEKVCKFFSVAEINELREIV